MKRLTMILVAACLLALLAPAAWARPLGVEVWTDRGDDAVYEPGENMQVKVRASDDAYLLVYEIDSEGQVRLLFPWRQQRGFAEGRRTYLVPPENARVDLVVESQVGQGYLVAIASREPFNDLPWYLRPYDAQAQAIGYDNEATDEEGITSEGRIVGDPFVAMERIRRRVLDNPEDGDEFATSYASYYVHHEVRYPRYLCYDCHRPNRWAWWDGFDPYYTSCSVFDFRVNWGWHWGPGYWYGNVPYYYYLVRTDCPPHYRRWTGDNRRWSSWDGWNRWDTLWGTHLRRTKTPPPGNYIPPSQSGRDVGRGPKPLPPGYFADGVRGPGARTTIPIGRLRPNVPAPEPVEGRRDPQWRQGGERIERPGAGRTPAQPPAEEVGDGRRKPEWRESPRYEKPAERAPDADPPRRNPNWSQPPPGAEPKQPPPKESAPKERGHSEKPSEPRIEPRKSQDAPPPKQHDSPQRSSEGRRSKGKGGN